MVVLEQTSQTLCADDLAVGVLRSRPYHSPAKSRVGALVVVVLQILPDDVPQLLLAGQDEVVEALALEASDEGLPCSRCTRASSAG